MGKSARWNLSSLTVHSPSARIALHDQSPRPGLGQLQHIHAGIMSCRHPAQAPSPDGLQLSSPPKPMCATSRCTWVQSDAYQHRCAGGGVPGVRWGCVLEEMCRSLWQGLRSCWGAHVTPITATHAPALAAGTPLPPSPRTSAPGLPLAPPRCPPPFSSPGCRAWSSWSCLVASRVSRL